MCASYRISCVTRTHGACSYFQLAIAAYTLDILNPRWSRHHWQHTHTTTTACWLFVRAPPRLPLDRAFTWAYDACSLTLALGVSARERFPFALVCALALLLVLPHEHKPTTALAWPIGTRTLMRACVSFIPPYRLTREFADIRGCCCRWRRRRHRVDWRGVSLTIRQPHLYVPLQVSLCSVL